MLVVLFALITPLLVMGMGLESPMVPAPRILLLLVKRIPDPNMQVVDAIFTVPVPVKWRACLSPVANCDPDNGKAQQLTANDSNLGVSAQYPLTSTT